MSGSTIAPNPGDSGQAERLAGLLALVQTNQELRRRLRLTLLAGSLVILAILGVFAYRVFAIFPEYVRYFDKLDFKQLSSAWENPRTAACLSTYENREIDDAVKYVIGEGRAKLPPAYRKAQKDLTERMLPEFSRLVAQKFEQRSKDFSEAGSQLAANLRTHAETTIRDQLFNSLAEGMGQSEQELQAMFPELQGRRIEDEITRSQAYFYDRLHAWGEEKVAQFVPVLSVLEARAERLAHDQSIPPEKRAELREQIFNDFLDGFMDRIKYELAPALGEQLADPVAPAGTDVAPAAAPATRPAVRPTKPAQPAANPAPPAGKSAPPAATPAPPATTPAPPAAKGAPPATTPGVPDPGTPAAKGGVR